MHNELQKHEPFIRMTYESARQAAEKGNHPFGALLVRDGKVIRRAENSVNSDRDVTRHAELNLVSDANRALGLDALSDATLYTSTEPCAMCAGAIFWAGISTIVYGCPAERLADFSTGSFIISSRELLRNGNRPITVIGPILEEEGIQIHRRFW